MKYFVFSLILLFLFNPFSGLNAQIGATSQDVNVNIVPATPGQYKIVNITLESYSIDINSSMITWRVNGAQKSAGRGQKTFNFTTGSYTETTTVNIIIESVNGEVINKTLRIKPTDVDLVWESEGYTPPFYRGKSDFTYQNKVTFIATPHITNSSGVEISPKNLVYKWKKNGSVIEDASGFGKNSYSLKGSIIARPIDITVEVTNLSADIKASAHLTVTPKDPLVLLYRKSPLYGIEFQKAISGNIEMKEKEIAVVGVPYFFGGTLSSSPKFIYKWMINGTKINENPSETTGVFRQAEGVSGTSNISLSVENNTDVLQLAKNSFQVTFGENQNENSDI